MNLNSIVAKAAVGALMALSSLGAAQAVTVAPPALTTFIFNGECTDCVPGFYDNFSPISEINPQVNVSEGPTSVPVTGSLVLRNYSAGSAITANNFVSFTYDGSSLVSAFTVVLAPQVATVSASVLGGPITYFLDSISGQVVPSAGNDNLSLTMVGGGFFNLFTGGEWNLCAAHAQIPGLILLDTSCVNLIASDFGFPGAFVAAPPPPTVPVSGTLLLLGAGLGALGLARRRRV